MANTCRESSELESTYELKLGEYRSNLELEIGDIEGIVEGLET